MANPFLVLGGVAVGIITAGIGVLAVPGWIHQAQDSVAMRDLAVIADAQGAVSAQRGEYIDEIDTLLNPGDGVTFTLGDGPELKSLKTNAKGDVWCAVVKSASGRLMARDSLSTETKDVESVEDGTASCGAAVSKPDETVLAYTLKCKDDETVALPMAKPQGKVEWGDGAEQDATGSVVSRDLAAGKTYTVTFTGDSGGFGVTTLDGRNCFRSMDTWASPDETVNGSYAFALMSNLTSVPDQVPAFSSTAGMFYMAGSFNQPINEWDTSKVTDMSSMFFAAGAFDQPLDAWDVSNVKSMKGMFQGATAFDEPLNDWDVSNVTDMGGLFNSATSFNRPLDKWVTSRVTDMSGMFSGAKAFNQPLGNWDTSHVATMNSMFYMAEKFDRPLNGWDVGNVTNMQMMFGKTKSFDQPLDKWETSDVTTMAMMFQDATAFNKPIFTDVSHVTNMTQMFDGASSFNQSLNSWGTTTSKVENVSYMFRNASSFNQPLDKWDTSSVTNMSNTFNGASSFSQDLSGWNVEKVSLLSRSNFATGSAMSEEQLPAFG